VRRQVCSDPACAGSEKIGRVVVGGVMRRPNAAAAGIGNETMHGSVNRDFRELHQFREACDVLGDEGIEGGRRHRCGLGSECRQLFDRLALLQRVGCFAVQSVNDLGRRSSGRKQAKP
jgi:hypothetical protein